MGLIAVENLAPGMVLEEDVYDINTRLLLSKGQKLANNHLRILKIWGVSEVKVVGNDTTAASRHGVVDNEKAEGVKRAIELVFKNANFANSTLKEICRVALIHRLKGDSTISPRLNSISGSQAMQGKSNAVSGPIQGMEDKLPETPTIISELNQVIADPLATSNDVARVVNTSPSLAATLLKIVNSAYYGFPSKIDRISRAVTVIGTREISNLALGISVMQTFKHIPKHIIDMQAFIRHSLACGIIARILAARNNLPQTEQLFVSGLLHDIGKLIVYGYYPEHATACFCLAESADTSVFQTEKNIIGNNHPQLAKHLLSKWKLPMGLTDNIIYHHAPSRASNPNTAGIVHLADIISQGLGIGYSGERSIPHFDYPIMEKIVDSRHSIQLVVRQAAHQLGSMEAIFHSQAN
jgi:HD-like signal output (HDOD) protein